MVPAIRSTAEAVPLCDNVQEHEQALFDAYICRELRFDVVEYPVGELNEGDLVHMTELVESIGNAHEQVHRPLGARRILNGHVDVWCWYPGAEVADSRARKTMRSCQVRRP